MGKRKIYQQKLTKQPGIWEGKKAPGLTCVCAISEVTNYAKIKATDLYNGKIYSTM